MLQPNNSFKINYLVVGAAKAGTTTIHDILSEIDSFSGPEMKETGFWSDLKQKYSNCSKLGFFHKMQIDNYDEYISLFDSKKKTFECSPDYLFHSTSVIKKLKKENQHPKILIILRNPIYRAISQYKHFKRDGIIKESFSQYIGSFKPQDNSSWALDIIKTSEYAQDLTNYINSGLDVKVVLYEDIFSSKNNLIIFMKNYFGLNEKHIQYRKSNSSNKNAVYRYYFALKKYSLIKKMSIFFRKFKLIKKIFNLLFFSFKENKCLDKNTRNKLLSYFMNDVKVASDIIRRDLTAVWKEFHAEKK